MLEPPAAIQTIHILDARSPHALQRSDWRSTSIGSSLGSLNVFASAMWPQWHKAWIANRSAGKSKSVLTR